LSGSAFGRIAAGVVTAVVAAMHKHVHQWTSEQHQPRQRTKQVSALLGPEEPASHSRQYQLNRGRSASARTVVVRHEVGGLAWSVSRSVSGLRPVEEIEVEVVGLGGCRKRTSKAQTAGNGSASRRRLGKRI
jgi:hypothetical protein